MNGLRVKDVNDLHINFQTQQTQVSNILVFFQHRQEIESIVAAKDRSWLVKNILAKRGAHMYSFGAK
jgi:hypothetical protein